MSPKQAERTTFKRCVLHHSSGRLKGMSQILGAIERPWEDGTAFPPTLTYGPREAPKQACHEAVKPRYVSYREFIPAARGRMNEFNPSQR